MEQNVIWQRPSTSGAVKTTRRFGAATLLALALVGGAGGAVGSAVTAAALTAPSAQATTLSAQPIAQTTLTNIAGTVLKTVGPSVVEITTAAQIGARNATATGIGSGFVLDASGLIATNNHVVDGATSISVTFSNGEKRSATVVGTDTAHDLAVIRVSDLPAGIAPVTLGDSAGVAAGDTAIAIGSPFGLEQTVTEGIVSAVNRTWSSGSGTYTGLLQTDAAINPGNSGGPLLNSAGEVIGINAMIESPVDGNVGIGFAVPINTLKSQLAQLEQGATLSHGYLGISIAEPTSASQSGVTVAAVTAGGGAAQAGLRTGDVITAIDGTAVTSYQILAAQITGKQPGEQVTVTYQRSGQQQQARVTLQAQRGS